MWLMGDSYRGEVAGRMSDLVFIVGIPFGSCFAHNVSLLSLVMGAIVGRQTYVVGGNNMLLLLIEITVAINCVPLSM